MGEYFYRIRINWATEWASTCVIMSNCPSWTIRCLVSKSRGKHWRQKGTQRLLYNAMFRLTCKTREKQDRFIKPQSPNCKMAKKRRKGGGCGAGRGLNLSFLVYQTTSITKLKKEEKKRRRMWGGRGLNLAFLI